jgi:parvulin-like peptidyl-prolyl isomerase
MDAARVTVWYVSVGLACAAGAGCETTTTAKLGSNTTLTANTPGTVRSQSPPEVVQTAAVTQVPARAEQQIRVVAVVGADNVVTDDEVWQMVRQRAGDYVKLVGTERTAKEKELFKEELRKLIERELVLAEMIARIKKNKPQLEEELKDASKKEADRRLTLFRKSAGIKTDEVFKDALASQGLTLAGLKRQLERDAMVDMLIGQQFRDKAKAVTLGETREYFDRHPEEFRTEDRVKWLDLFVSVRQFLTPDQAKAHAETLLAKAKAGGDFVELVKAHDQGDSKLRGGEGIGQKKGEIEPKELETTLFAMRTGEISNLIPVATGYHIVKVVEREVAGQRPFDEKVQVECKGKVAAKLVAREKDKLIDELWRKFKPEVVED